MKLESEDAKEKNTLNQRYVYKLISNLITISAGLLTAAIVPRALGVDAYGVFSYTNNVITQMLSFLDMRASTCFYVKLSQRQSESKIITFYGIYTFLIFLSLLFVMSILIFAFSPPILFGGISKIILVLSVSFVIAKWIADIFIKISDAYGTTVSVERIKIISSISGVIILSVLFYFGVVNLKIFYIHQILVFSIFSMLVLYFLRKWSYKIPLVAFMDVNDFKKYIREFFVYSSPLAIYLVVTLLTEVFDRFTLQHFGGSYQQGLYGFSFSISSMTIFFVTSMVPLFTREFSLAFATGNIKLAGDLYRKYVPTMYLISAYFCCFLFVNAESLILIFGGDQFKESILSLRILLIYPLLSTYSNLNGSVIYAQSGNSLFRNISLILLPAGILATFFLTSNQFMNLGAMGLALKITLLESISVIIVMFYIAKHLKITLYKYFIHMILSPILFIILAFAVRRSLHFVYSVSDNLFSFLLSGAVYSLALGIAFYLFPNLTGLTKNDIQSLKQGIRRTLRLESRSSRF